uniref:U3 small nucleolar RNA-associated protein 6 n=1 Tax=Romanomermis culicivorax TaxID=13658 RepID=A0A915IZL4_ROMCU
EYKLTTKPVKKESYLSYIEYLKNFSLLLHHRRGLAKFMDNKEDIEKNLSIKIGNLYRKLYFSLGKIYFELLKVHTQKPYLWISAAQYELDINESIENARSLLQRALRFNADSKQLWLELFRLELIFVDKIIKRKEILKGQEDDRALENEDAILSGKLAFLVFRQALKQISITELMILLKIFKFICQFLPDEPSLCLDFIKLTRGVSLPFSEELIDDILEHVADNTADSEEKCDCFITYAFDKGLESVIESDEMQILEDECSELYKQACEKFPTGKMICLHLEFLLKRYKYASDSSKNAKVSI